MSDEAWDMLWESLKEYCKVNNLEEEYIKYDNIFRSVLLYNKQEEKQKYIKEGMDAIVNMFTVTDAEEGDS
tara:strand:- start:1446 stop:1658 length:213 start_codon:yes stop_codon:yes gene_type:complete